MAKILFKEGIIVNRGKSSVGDVLVDKGRIVRIGTQIQSAGAKEIPLNGKILMPGIIDDQVHFREPGLTHKAEIATEARAAVAGGGTTFMEKANTQSPALTQGLLEDNDPRAATVSLASNDNYEEVMRTDPKTVCGIKIFMGSSTGNMLVDNPSVLERVFADASMLIATHCEDEATIHRNLQAAREKWGDQVPVQAHPDIRSAEGCYLSSSMAIRLANKHNTRLHILHISTADECALFDNKLSLENKRITSEVCVHHLYFNGDDYNTLGNQIKCNPAVKAKSDQDMLLKALLDDRLDIIATDHAPHTWEEKQKPYLQAPSGVPLVQHSLNVMLSFYQQGRITLERIVEKMCHAPAICFQIQDRGFIDEGAWADLVVVDTGKRWKVTRDNIHYKCGWSPFEGHVFQGKVEATMVNGHFVYRKGRFNTSKTGRRLLFNR